MPNRAFKVSLICVLFHLGKIFRCHPLWVSNRLMWPVWCIWCWLCQILMPNYSGTQRVGDWRPAQTTTWHGAGEHQAKFEHFKKVREQPCLSYFWNAFGVTAEYPATLVHLIYMCREAPRTRHNTMDAILIQWHVNEWQGIQQFSHAF